MDPETQKWDHCDPESSPRSPLPLAHKVRNRIPNPQDKYETSPGFPILSHSLPDTQDILRQQQKLQQWVPARAKYEEVEFYLPIAGAECGQALFLFSPSGLLPLGCRYGSIKKGGINSSPSFLARGLKKEALEIWKYLENHGKGGTLESDLTMLFLNSWIYPLLPPPSGLFLHYLVYLWQLM